MSFDTFILAIFVHFLTGGEHLDKCRLTPTTQLHISLSQEITQRIRLSIFTISISTPGGIRLRNLGLARSIPTWVSLQIASCRSNTCF